MTGKNKRPDMSEVISTLSLGALHVEMKKSSRGAVAVITGVMSVSEYSETGLILLSHSGRVMIVGEALGISVLEGRVIEVYGKITDMRFSYGKN